MISQNMNNKKTAIIADGDQRTSMFSLWKENAVSRAEILGHVNLLLAEESFGLAPHKIKERWQARRRTQTNKLARIRLNTYHQKPKFK